MGLLRDFITHFKESSGFRQKVFFTIALNMVVFCEGWGRGLLGPPFVDLQRISGVDLDTGSWLFSSFFIGYAVGAFAGGFIYNHVNHKIILMTTQIGLACTFFVIPWCTIFGLMAFAFGVQGTLNGIMEAVVTPTLVNLWPKYRKSFYLTTGLIFTSGAILAPVATAPYLMTSTIPRSNVSGIKVENTTVTISSGNNSSVLQPETSKLYVTYSISGSLLVMAGAFCIISRCLDFKFGALKSEGKKEEDSKENVIQRNQKALALMVMAALICCEVSMDEAIYSFMPVFCIKHADWTESYAAFTISVSFFSATVSSVLGVFIVNFISIQTFVGISLAIGLLATVGLTLSAMFYVDFGIWLSIAAYHFGKGNVYVLVYMWTNEHITILTGKIVSIYVISCMTGSSLNPILIGHLMENVSNLWFCYVLVIEGLLMISVYVAALIVTRSLVRQHGTVNGRSRKRESISMND